MELSVVGLRELAPFDMDKIQNPFMEFALSTYEPGHDNRIVAKTSACSTPSGKIIKIIHKINNKK